MTFIWAFIGALIVVHALLAIVGWGMMIMDYENNWYPTKKEFLLGLLGFYTYMKLHRIFKSLPRSKEG